MLPIHRINLFSSFLFTSSQYFLSGGFTSGERKANSSYSELGSIICLQLDDLHNTVPLGKHPLKNVSTISSTTQKVWGWSSLVDSLPWKCLLSKFSSVSNVHISGSSQMLAHLYASEGLCLWMSVIEFASVCLESSSFTGMTDGRIIRPRGTMIPWLQPKSPWICLLVDSNLYLFCSLIGLSQPSRQWPFKYLPSWLMVIQIAGLWIHELTLFRLKVTLLFPICMFNFPCSILDIRFLSLVMLTPTKLGSV